MKLLLLSACVVSAGTLLLASCDGGDSRGTRVATVDQAVGNSEQGDGAKDGGPPVMGLIRQAEADYRTFLEKHEAARSATKVRRSPGAVVEAGSPQAILLQRLEEESLAARAKAAETRNASWKTVQAYSGSPFERKQAAAFLRRYELREEIRLAALAAELYASDPERADDFATAERRLEAYREKLGKEEAAWDVIEKGGWRKEVGE